MNHKNTLPGLSRRSTLQLGSVVLMLGVQHIARGATIVAVRVWPSKDYTRLTIESDAPITARQAFIPEPPRLVVDIEGIDLIPALRELVAKVQSDDPNISGIRIGQSQPGVVRLVIDLKKPMQPQVFNLAPVAAYQHRLVLDLYPAQPVNPLQTLLKEKTEDAPSMPTIPGIPRPLADLKQQPLADDPIGDPIGDLISDPLGTLIAQQFKKAADTSTTQLAQKENLPVTSPSKKKTDRLIIVALDPGHGGEDPGAIGPGGTREKDVVLQIALRLRDRINQQTNMRAFLTRDADFFVPLQVRVQKARSVKADLFISVHADAFLTAAPAGASVFALSEKGASSSAARWLANKENSADLVGGVNATSKDSQVRQALFDMSTTAQIKDSMKLGSVMLGQIGSVGKLHKGRVEQASFAVLKAPDIPSVLVETAFISNPAEEVRLRDVSYQIELANALMRGISLYFSKNPPLARSRAL
jgi:N-acetylmuramoyl-L-alanine amidase